MTAISRMLVLFALGSIWAIQLMFSLCQTEHNTDQ